MDDKTLSHGYAGKPQVLREFEFYGGCIRVKISVKNTSGLAILDAALELESDEKVLHYDRCEPAYPEKKGKIILGNINPNTDRTVAFHLDPLICAKEGTDINCRVNFKYADGTPDTVNMERLKIQVVCPIFRTEHDINIGRLKELIKELHSSDSKVYTIPKRMDLSESLKICRNVIQQHDVRHIKTFRTTDDTTYECWYFGKTKVTKKDLVIKCAIRKDTESIEIFVSGNDPKDITGLLAEIGRNLTKEFDKIGKVQPVFNVVVKNSMVKGSDLLSFCDLDGICGGNVVIEDSFVEWSNVASWNREDKEKARIEEQKKLVEARKQEKQHEVDLLRKTRKQQEKDDKRAQIEQGGKTSGGKLFYAVIILFGVLALGWYVTQDSNNPAISTPQKTTPSVTTTPEMTAKVAPSAAAVVTPSADQKTTSSSAVLLQGEKTDVVLGEDILLKLSAVNLITMPPMSVQVLINPPSGMSVTGSEFVESGAGIYTTIYTLNPGDGKDIQVHIKSNQVGDFNVKGRIVYYFGEDKDKAEDHTLNLPIKVRKEAASQQAQTQAPNSNPSIEGFEAIISIFGILLVSFLRKKW